MTETSQAGAERLLLLGLDLAVRVRDDDPAQLADLLDGLDKEELHQLVLTLARCVDISLPVSEIVWWRSLTSLPRASRGDTPPCGTSRGYKAHMRARELPDLACEVAYRREERERKARTRRAST